MSRKQSRAPIEDVDVDPQRIAAHEPAAECDEVRPGRRAGVSRVQELERAGGNGARHDGPRANARELERAGARDAFIDRQGADERGAIGRRRQQYGHGPPIVADPGMQKPISRTDDSYQKLLF